MYIFLISDGFKIFFTHIIVYYMRTYYAENGFKITCYYYIIRQII